MLVKSFLSAFVENGPLILISSFHFLPESRRWVHVVFFLFRKKISLLQIEPRVFFCSTWPARGAFSARCAGTELHIRDARAMQIAIVSQRTCTATTNHAHHAAHETLLGWTILSRSSAHGRARWTRPNKMFSKHNKDLVGASGAGSELTPPRGQGERAAAAQRRAGRCRRGVHTGPGWV